MLCTLAGNPLRSTVSSASDPYHTNTPSIILNCSVGFGRQLTEKKSLSRYILDYQLFLRPHLAAHSERVCASLAPHLLYYSDTWLSWGTGTYVYSRWNTGWFEMIVRVLTTCHTQYTSDSSICVFLFNRTTLQVFVTYLTGALYVHRLWCYRVIPNDCQGFNNLSYTMHFR